MSTATEEFSSLIKQLAFLDDEHHTDIAGYLTTTIGEIKADGLSKDEASELLADRIKLLKVESVLTDDEQIRLVETIISHIPALLSL